MVTRSHVIFLLATLANINASSRPPYHLPIKPTSSAPLALLMPCESLWTDLFVCLLLPTYIPVRLLLSCVNRLLPGFKVWFLIWSGAPDPTAHLRIVSPVNQQLTAALYQQSGRTCNRSAASNLTEIATSARPPSKAKPTPATPSAEQEATTCFPPGTVSWRTTTAQVRQ